MANRLFGCMCALFALVGGATAADQGGYGGGGNYDFSVREDSEQQTLQQATSLAIGNLAWESVNVSEVRKGSGQVKWVAKTRSNTYRCAARADGQHPYCDPAVAIQLQRNTVTVNGRDRGYLYYVSSKHDRQGFNAVVYAIHDNGQTPQQFAEQSGWVEVAEEQGFAVVFPEAERQTWASNSGGEDAYIKAVYDHAIGHLQAGGGERAAGERPAAGGEGPAAGRPAAGGERPAAGGRGRPQGISTWAPFNYVTGVGVGATVAQEFAMNNPGIFAAMATLDGGAYAAAYAKGEETAQGYYQNQRGGKNAEPVWKQLKKDVAVAAWLFTTGSPAPAETRQIEYWKRSNGVATTAQRRVIEGFDTSVYKSSANEYQQVRTTTVADSAKYDKPMASAIWRDLFSGIARWTSSPNGHLGSLLSKDQVKQTFDVRTLNVDGATYTYYVKVPSTYRKGRSLPLVLAAAGGNYPTWIYLSQIKMHEVGEKEGFITVYMNGQEYHWNFEQPDGADVKFVRGVIDDVIKTYGADKTRVYMQGFSLGSGMSYMMGITHPQLFAAVSPNNGIGPMAPEVNAWTTKLKDKSDLRIPMLMLYGDVDAAASTDAKIPARSVLRGAIDEMKKYNNITTSDKVVTFDSPNTAPYDVLVPGGDTVREGVDARYPDGRFLISRYLSNDPKPLPLFSFVWVTDLPHGADPGTAQLEWDFFKQWRRNADGSLTFTSR